MTGGKFLITNIESTLLSLNFYEEFSILAIRAGHQSLKNILEVGIKRKYSSKYTVILYKCFCSLEF